MTSKADGVLTQSTALQSSEHTTKLLKNFKWKSLLGIAFSLTNSWLGVSSSLVVGLSSGGPLLILYGLIIGVFFTFMCGWSLAEFASVLPSSSGPSFWVLKLLEKDNSGAVSTGLVSLDEPEYSFDDVAVQQETEENNLEWACTSTNVSVTSFFQSSLALAVGLLNYFGAVFTTASVFSSLALSILGVHSLLHTSYELKHWHVFVVYELLNFMLTILGCWSGILPALSQFGLYMSLFTYLITFVISLVSRSNHSDIPWPKSSEIFGKFRNTTGWNSSGMAFVVGLINPLWAFAGIDSATHMVDEVGYKASTILVPQAILSTIIIGFLTSFTYAIGMFFCVTDTEKVTESILPILEIYYQATGNRNLSVFMQCCCILTGITCGIASVTWQSRILWSLGKDFSKLTTTRPICKKTMGFFGALNSKLRAPLNAHFFSQICVAIIGCIFMGSSTAFNAIITACITLLLLTYAIPCVIVLLVGKREFYERVKNQLDILSVNLGRVPICNKISLIPNVFTIMWALFCLIFLSFPYSLPVSASTMNYVTVVYGAVAFLIGTLVLI
ncbi:LAQU0S19e00166g1_1 [Lachancea quebecensis]|uniref:LAQU0S19e00166g1_1 n=1 Tax=Lachancea quebecensis TaxID=1654605 RepID=A0A0P1KXJ6_9SACH|nr:LAQU0S19e00166g1_1 [Lachancea quebecensis]